MNAYIIHYMDDILMGHKDKEIVKKILVDLIKSLEDFGLIIAPDKIQKERPIRYLGHEIHDQHLASQHIQIRRDNLCTLNDFQKLLGNINWIRPYLKITTGELSPLFNLLHGDSYPKSKRVLSKEAIEALQLVEKKLNGARLHQITYTLPWSLLIIKTSYTPTGCLWQSGILEWLHLPHTQAKILTSYADLVAQLIIKGKNRSKEIFKKDMQEIIVPYSKTQFEYLLQENENWGLALTGYAGQIKYHLPKHPVLKFVKETKILFPEKCSITPLETAFTIFTDGSNNGTTAVWVEEKPPIVSHTDKTLLSRLN